MLVATREPEVDDHIDGKGHSDKNTQYEEEKLPRSARGSNRGGGHVTISLLVMLAWKVQTIG